MPVDNKVDLIVCMNSDNTNVELFMEADFQKVADRMKGGKV